MHIQRMMKVVLPLMISIAFYSWPAHSDISPAPGYEPVTVKEVLLNIDEFPGISFIAYSFLARDKREPVCAYIIQHDKPLNQFHALLSLGRGYVVYAVKTEYLKGKDLNTIDFSKDHNFIPMSNDLQVLRTSRYYAKDVKKHIVEYTILGFRNGRLIIYKSGEILKYGFFSRNKTTRFNKPDTTGVTASF